MSKFKAMDNDGIQKTLKTARRKRKRKLPGEVKICE